MKILSGSMCGVTVNSGDSDNEVEEEQMRPQITEVTNVLNIPKQIDKKGSRSKNKKLEKKESSKKNIVKVDLVIKNKKQNVNMFLNKAKSLGVYNGNIG